MYLWKTKKLAESLKNNSLKQSEYKNYYIATAVLTLIGFYSAVLNPPETLYAVIFEAVGSILVTVIGLNMAFSANGGNAGTGYLDKIVSLSFPLLVKVIVAATVLAIPLEIMRQLNTNAQQVDWMYSAAVVLIQLIFFWRITVHVKYING
jgi:ABC-type antimicrobial peptide transport system permease subunit